MTCFFNFCKSLIYKSLKQGIFTLNQHFQTQFFNALIVNSSLYNNKLMKTKILNVTIFLILIFLNSGINIIAKEQTQEIPPWNKGTIKTQFDYLIIKSLQNSDYRMVNQNWLYILKSRVLDTIKIDKQNLNEAIAMLKALIESSRGEVNVCRVWDSTFKTSIDDYKKSIELYCNSWILPHLIKIQEKV